jgi:hypothetical protein
MPVRRFPSLAGALVLLGGCSSSSASVHLPSFDDVSSAPPAIQTAAQAIVLIGIPGAVATGSFISPDGLLLTNNHVLGAGVCPIEGCYAQVTWMYQRGAPLQPAITLYVIPRAVDIGLDMAVLQASVAPGAPPFATPQYLTIDSHDPASLLGTHINIVGHPEGSVKKWSAGEVISTDGSWIWTSAFILPGNSGSPILDDHGHLVGLIHRAPTDEDLVADDGIDLYSIGTASSALIGAMGAPLPASMWSTAAPATDADVVYNQLVYLAARVQNANVGGAAKPVLTSLGAACDQGLAVNDYASPEDLESGLQPCLDAEAWIECRTDSMTAFGVCPDATDAAAWLQRYQAVFDTWVAFNGQLELDETSFAPAALSSSMAAGQTAGAQRLSQALASTKPALDFHVAPNLAAFAIATYQGTSVVDFTRGYASVPDYAFWGESIVETVLFLNHADELSGSDTGTLLTTLAADPTIDLGTKLYIEQVQYNSGALP